MSYEPGYIHWHRTTIDGHAIIWIAPDDEVIRIVSILDHASVAPARRVLRDGTVQPLDDEPRGLTVYGTHVWDRPTLDELARLAPEHEHLALGLAEGRGVTVQDITGRPRPGRPTVGPKREVRLSPELDARVDQLAQEAGVSRAEQLRRLVEAGLRAQESGARSED